LSKRPIYVEKESSTGIKFVPMFPLLSVLSFSSSFPPTLSTRLRLSYAVLPRCCAFWVVNSAEHKPPCCLKTTLLLLADTSEAFFPSLPFSPDIPRARSSSTLCPEFTRMPSWLATLSSPGFGPTITAWDPSFILKFRGRTLP
jgi:hypothetical protein